MLVEVGGHFIGVVKLVWYLLDIIGVCIGIGSVGREGDRDEVGVLGMGFVDFC